MRRSSDKQGELFTHQQQQQHSKNLAERFGSCVQPTASVTNGSNAPATKRR